MSLYEQSEKKLDELTEIISEIRSSKSTLTGSAKNIEEALDVFTSCIKELQISANRMNEQYAAGISSHKGLINKLDEAVIRVQEENAILRRDNEEINARFFHLNKTYQDAFQKEANEKLTLLETNVNSTMSEIRSLTKKADIFWVVVAIAIAAFAFL